MNIPTPIRLPHCTPEQKQYCEDLLVENAMTHREMARALRAKFPDFAQDVPDTSYEEMMIERLRDWLYDKRKPIGRSIADRREAREHTIDTSQLDDPVYRKKCRDRIMDRLVQLDGKLERGELEEKKYLALQTGAMNRLKILNDYDRKSPEKPKGKKPSSRPGKGVFDRENK